MFSFLNTKTLIDQNDPLCGKLIRIRISDIRPNPNQPRRNFDLAALQELSTSIQIHGLMQPIIVRATEGGYELIAGERRWRACSMAGLHEIDAILMDADSERSSCLALIENLHRRDLHFFEEAESYSALINLYNLTQDQLAEKIGKKQSTIANKLRVNRIPSSLKAMIISEGLSERHARALLRLQSEEDQLAAIEKIVENALSVKETEDLIDKMLYTPPKPKKNILHLVRNYRLAVNSIKATLNELNEAGVNTTFSMEDYDAEILVTISIPKR